MNWSAPLEVFRPFLSYSELGAPVSGMPSDMYDARRRLDEPSNEVDKQLPGLRRCCPGPGVAEATVMVVFASSGLPFYRAATCGRG